MHLEFITELSEVEGEFRGRCTQFPGIGCTSPSEAQALQNIVSLVGLLIADSLARGVPLPEDWGPDRTKGEPSQP